ncbi:cathepsin L-like proteinase [Nymphalis io]|uniref:cathepsin L-like proteinase n=1 Tax=Inachis io TaxID=171585 RepID=UPI00216967C2|nr:cathepsin L-like proteinase [Nymphalis io]
MAWASLNIVLLLIIAFDPGFSFSLGGEENVLKFPTEYSIRGEITNLFTGIIKPFEFWYSAELNMSRIDYYGGMVMNYYIAESEEDYGREYAIYPRTTDEMTSEIVCDEDTWEGEQKNLMTSSENFTYFGETIYNDKSVQIWKYIETDGDDNTKEEQTIYAYKSTDGDYVPVLYESLRHNLWSGALDSHIIIRYFNFSPLDAGELNLTNVEACKDTIKREHTKHKFNDLHELSTDVDDAFLSFKIQHKKKYKVNEHEMRKQIFKKNLRRVLEQNQKNLSYKLTINKFSDLTDDELGYLFATRPSDPHDLGSMPFPHTIEEVEEIAQDLPENYDMRVEGFISSIKNQGSCGSCWAFATTAAVEGALARSNGARNLDLSEQSLVDCAWGYDNYGCKGGMLDRVFKYVLKHGIPTEEDYGLYLEENGFCAIDNMTDVYRIRGFAQVSVLSVNAMKVALYKYGPVTVAINSSPIIQYRNGIFYDPDCNEDHYNHAVTVVGYGVRDGATYWIVKNSWGEDWGEDGYVLISATNNNCHILEEAYYPII